MEINKALKDIIQMTEIMKQTVETDGQKLQGIVKQQKVHEHNVKDKINVDLKVTENYQDKMCRGCCKYGILAACLAAIVVGLVFLTK